MQERLIENEAHKFYKDYDSDPTLKDQVTPCGFLDLLHFADKFDIVLMFFGAVFAIGSGVSLIFYSGPLAQMIAALAPDKDLNQVVENAWIALKGLALNSVIVFLNCWFMSAAWTVSAERQVNKARKAYFQALLHQEVTWHDRKKPQETCSKMYMHISGLQTALVTNVTGLLSQLSIGVAGLVISFIRGWQMSLVMMSFLPIMIISGVLSSKAHQKFNKFNNKNLPVADGNVSEVFQNLKTVKYLNGEQHEIGMFQRSIDRISQFTLTHERLPAVCTGLFMLCLFLNYSVGFWYGSKMVTSEEHSNYTASDVLIIFGVLYLSNLNIICIPDSISNFLISRVAMTHIINIVNRVPKSISGTKPCPSEITKIEFKDVMFQFDKPLFDGLNITISKGIVALIGQSGSGKTTLVNLICKFYEPFRGQIILHTLNGAMELRQVEVKNLMNKIGYVGQEPVLIGKTIRQVLGAEEMSNEEIMEALEIAQAVSFVVQIGLDQEFGALSGGQKQRIAIARALCRKPEILILDEGTSALDRLNEQLIFKSLRKSKNIHFIIMVAHRMETVRNADLIFSINKGKIIGSGTYAELVNLGLIKDTLQKISHEAQEEGEQQKQEELEFEPQQSKTPLEEAPELKFQFSYLQSLFRYNQKYCSVYVIGLICSAINGTAFPLFSYVISQIISILSSVQYEDSSALPALRERSNNLSLLLFGVSVTMFLVISLRCLILNFIREKIGVFLKKKSFRHLIRKKMIEVQKFGTRNTADIIIFSSNGMKELIGNHIGNLCENIATLSSGLAIAFYFSWQIALLSLGIFPLIILAGKAQMDLRYGMMSRTGDNHKSIHTTIVDTIVNIRTIKSLSLQAKTVSRYEDSLNQSLKLACKYGNLSGIALGIGQALTSILFAIIFYVGALFVRDKYITVLDLYTSVNAIMFSGIQAGIGINFINGLAKGKLEAARYFSQVPEEDNQEDINVASTEEKKALHGPIVIKNLCFKYPIKNESVFENFNLRIEENEKIAFVGESGSGKSTLANLLLRVYEPDSGSISIGGYDYNDLLKEEISKAFAIVSQEPVLFNRSVGDNIKYNTNADLQQVVEATKKTNAYDFIMEGNFGLEKIQDNNEKNDDQLSENSLGKEKYHELVNDSDDLEARLKKNVGPKGSHLSGGQKQRVAIARALVRKPKIIVFDEATSALDTNNEILIQEALSALPNTTQIIIAHRLSTIKECDRIVVLGAGKVLEMGKYDELLQKEGHFYRLVNALRQKE